jgi:hypothetical protein
MVTINLKNGLFKLFELLQFLEVEWLSQVLLIALVFIVKLNKGVDECLEFCLGLVSTDIGTPDNLGVLARFVVHLLHTC